MRWLLAVVVLLPSCPPGGGSGFAGEAGWQRRAPGAESREAVPPMSYSRCRGRMSYTLSGYTLEPAFKNASSMFVGSFTKKWKFILDFDVTVLY